MGKRLISLALGAVVFALSGCGGTAQSSEIKADPLNAPTIADFSNGKVSEIFASDGWTNGGNFNCVWSDGNITYSGGEMHLAIKEEKKSAWVDDKQVEYDHTGGEARSFHHYGFGDYEVKMRPTDVVGSVSSFFVCTGNYDKVNGKENPWDEVDIEFLGKDTTHVQFNYFVNGKGGHEHMHDLGFDASKEFHEYGFRWAKDSITWFIDDKPVYQVKETSSNPLPKTPGRVLTNYWPCSSEGWAGKYEGNQGKTTDYKWMKCSGETSLIDGEKEPSEPSSSTSKEDSSQEESGINWDEIATTDLTFTSEESKYVIEKSNGVTTVTYEGIGGQTYRNINAPISDVAAGKSAFRATLKNAGTVKNRVRVNLIDPKKAGQQNACCNVSATMNGSEVYTDTSWGGSFFEIPAGETVTAIVNYDGNPNSLEFMIDSSCLDADERSGKLEISEIKFGGEGKVEPVQSSSEEDTSEEENSEVDSVQEDASLALSFASTDIYTVTPSGTASKEIDVVYTNVGGQSYANIGTSINGIANTYNLFKTTIENKGEASSRIRIDIQGTTSVGNTNSINTNAYADNHTEIYTDTTWGGSYITLAAGEKVTFNVEYDESTDRGSANYMLFFIDSATDNGDAHAGHLVFSDFYFLAKN